MKKFLSVLAVAAIVIAGCTPDVDPVEPDTEVPGTEDPGTEDPGTEDPGTEDPGTEDPGTDVPGTEDPGTEDPGTEDPGTEDPGTVQPVVAESLTIDYPTLTVIPGMSYTYITTMTPAEVDDDTITWTSSNDGVVSVDQSGKMTAVAEGSAKITATAVGGASVTAEVSVLASAAAKVDYVDEYGVNHGKGLAIGSLVWAPVNCGYKAAVGDDKGYRYGKLYQWGRKDGQGYDENDASYPDGETLVTGSAESVAGADPNTFYIGPKATAYDWICTQAEYWGATKTQYDPCPAGWRVPTKDEVSALITSKSQRIETETGQSGYLYYDGAVSRIEGAPEVFLVEVGARHNNGSLQYTNCGLYWSATVSGTKAANLAFDANGPGSWKNNVRGWGMFVRCVQE